MTNTEILTKAIQKVTEAKGVIELKDGSLLIAGRIYEINPDSCFNIIFNHQFAKSFFGKEELEPNEVLSRDRDMYRLFDGTIFGSITTLPAYQYHLMMMVVAKNPIEYLGKFV